MTVLIPRHQARSDQSGDNDLNKAIFIMNVYYDKNNKYEVEDTNEQMPLKQCCHSTVWALDSQCLEIPVFKLVRS